jgi:hypothetical protein
MTLTEVATIVQSDFVEMVFKKQDSAQIEYSARIDGVEIVNEGILSGVTGYGHNKTAARKDLAQQLQGATLVRHPGAKDRWEVTLPDTISPRS